MLDMKNLSKLKYIYRIYESSDKILHLEKYPIIYINSEVVYFKDGRKQEYLNSTRVEKVLDNFVSACNSNRFGHYSTYIDKYFWNIETNVQEIYEDLKKQRAELKSKDEEQKKHDRLERAKREYEAALKEVELLNSLKKEN